jgi:uncharacterized membrane protein
MARTHEAAALQVAHWSAIASLIALLILCLLWESVLAPLRPGGSFLMLKALPLLAPLFGILRERPTAYVWTTLLALAYFAEGVVRFWSEGGQVQQLAIVEIALSLVLFASCAVYLRAVHRRGASV